MHLGRFAIAGKSVALALLAAACTQDTSSDSVEPSTALACDQLTDFAVSGVDIQTAESMATWSLSAGGPGSDSIELAVPHCRVAGTIDTSIGFELLLPDDWNGKFMMGGGGGFVGSIQNQAQDLNIVHGGTALERGYATAGTDTGHQGGGIDGSWALNNQRAQEDFGYRAVHRTTEVSKAIIAHYYADPAERSYFFGCSRGGGQALISAQRYPEDFDGIVAGAPAYDWTGVVAGMVRTQQSIFPDPGNTTTPVITAANRELLARWIMAQCDTIDGVEDGILADPRACPFNPATLPRCTNGPEDTCLTGPQLEAVQAVYAPLIVDGREIYTGWPFGGETVGWPFWITKADGPQPLLPPGGPPNAHFGFGTEVLKHFVFSDPNWSYVDYNFDGYAEQSAATADLLNSTNPDMSALRDRGGKLILWHGWSDAALSALDSIDYYESVTELDSAANDYFRMFLLPGVAHCFGGPGPDSVDWITAIEQWVEDDIAPEQATAVKLDSAGDITMERPVCAYPAAAVYDGQGSPDTAAGFACEVPAAQ